MYIVLGKVCTLQLKLFTRQCIHLIYAISCAISLKEHFKVSSVQYLVYSVLYYTIHTVQYTVYRALSQVVLVHALIPPSLSWLHCTQYTLYIIPRPGHLYRGNICRCSPCTDGQQHFTAYSAYFKQFTISNA